MNKIQPSARHKQALNELLEGGLTQTRSGSNSTFIGEFVTRAIQRLATEALEQEIADFLGRDYYQRRSSNEPVTGYRNGYEIGRLKTAEGGIPIERPQVRDTEEPFQSRLWQLLKQSPAFAG